VVSGRAVRLLEVAHDPCTIYHRQCTFSGRVAVSLNIEAEWGQPIPLRSAARGAIYECPDLIAIPEGPGIYIFYREHSKQVTPFYVGRTEKLRRRIKQQFNSVKLMTSIRDAETGSRFLIYCQPRPKRGQQMKAVIRIMEEGLIAHLLSEGCELMQKQGVRRPTHTVKFRGNRTSEAISPRFMRVRA
jgi:hypothetical protein